MVCGRDGWCVVGTGGVSCRATRTSLMHRVRSALPCPSSASAPGPRTRTVRFVGRGGSIVPLQVPGMTTAFSRYNRFELIVALSPEGTASGRLFWDDGVSHNAMASGILTATSVLVQGPK